MLSARHRDVESGGVMSGNPNAIGTSRTITVEPSALPRIGSMQYPHQPAPQRS
ncbi:MAG: hypothetical protein WDN48_13845 [Pseudolabrys sp.]